MYGCIFVRLPPIMVYRPGNSHCKVPVRAGDKGMHDEDMLGQRPD
jgi:hypothetical protein